MIQHQLFKERVGVAIGRAGIALAAGEDPSFSWGAYLEIIDGDTLPPSVSVQWRVHPELLREFKSVELSRLLEDASAKEYMVVQRAMGGALIAILENAGFNATTMKGERAGEILVTGRDPEQS